MAYWIQFILALPLLLAGVGVFVSSLMNPGGVGLLRLSFFAFVAQFCIGPVMNLFSQEVPINSPAADIFMTFATIYLFFIGAAVVAFLWRSRLEPVLMVRGATVAQERGIFASLTEASLRASVLASVLFYVLVTVIRLVMYLQYGVGLSGTGTEEKTLAIPYWLLAIHKTFHALGLTFVYVAITKLIYRQKGTFWWVLIIVIEGLNTFVKGRRKLFSLMVLMFFALLMKHGRMKPRHAVLAAIGALVLWKLVFPMFYNMRNQWLAAPDAPVSQWVQAAWTDTVTGGTYGIAEMKYSRSFTGRLSALSENYQLAGFLNAGMPVAGGQFLQAAFLTTVPRILFPTKLATLRTDDELMSVLYPMGGFDLASNLPAFAMADFGPMGGLLYGALFALSLRIIELMLRVLFARSPVGAMALFSATAFDIILQVEVPPGSFAVVVRLACFIFVVIYCWTALLGRPLTSQAQAQPLPAS